MGLSTGGLFIKGKNLPTVQELFESINWGTPKFQKEDRLSSVMSIEFEEVAIFYFQDWMGMINRDFPYSCSFEDDLSSMDKRLSELSKFNELIVFHLQSISQTYCFSRFHNNGRIAVYCKSGGELIYTFPSEWPASEEKLVWSQVDDVIGTSINKIKFEDKLNVEVYKRSQ